MGFIDFFSGKDASVSKDVLKAVNSGDTKALMEKTTTDPVTIKSQESPKIYAADYFRYGRLENVDGALTQTQPIANLDDWDDGTHKSEQDQLASIRVKGKVDKKSKDEVDMLPPYTKFFLTGVSEGHTERNQIIQTFGDFYVFFFGEQAPIYTFSGSLVNAKNTNWLSDFMFYYENFFRGTKAVQNNTKIVITYQGRLVEGFLLGTSNVTRGDDPFKVDMNFQVVVTYRTSLIESDDFAELEGANNYQKIESLMEMINGEGLSITEVSKAFKTASDSLKEIDAMSKCKPLKKIDSSNILKSYGLPGLPEMLTA